MAFVAGPTDNEIFIHIFEISRRLINMRAVRNVYGNQVGLKALTQFYSKIGLKSIPELILMPTELLHPLATG